MNFDNILHEVANNIMPVILLPNGLYCIPTSIYPQWENESTPSGLSFYFGPAWDKLCFVPGTWDTSTYYYDEIENKWHVRMLY